MDKGCWVSTKKGSKSIKRRNKNGAGYLRKESIKVGRDNRLIEYFRWSVVAANLTFW